MVLYPQNLHSTKVRLKRTANEVQIFVDKNLHFTKVRLKPKDEYIYLLTLIDLHSTKVRLKPYCHFSKLSENSIYIPLR